MKNEPQEVSLETVRYVINRYNSDTLVKAEKDALKGAYYARDGENWIACDNLDGSVQQQRSSYRLFERL